MACDGKLCRTIVVGTALVAGFCHWAYCVPAAAEPLALSMARYSVSVEPGEPPRLKVEADHQLVFEVPIVSGLATTTAEERISDIRYEVKKGDKKRDESFCCPSDAKIIKSDDFDKLCETMLSFRKLFYQLDDSGAGSRLLLIDACRDEAGSTRNANTNAMPNPRKGTAALFACKGGERANETWDSLIATPLSARDILQSKLLAVLWRMRALLAILLGHWIIGLVADAIHPVGLLASVLVFGASIWLLLAFGIFISVGAKDVAATTGPTPPMIP